MNEKKSHPIKKISGSLAGLLILLAALIAGNIIVKNIRLRADLTQEKRFSLSQGTKNTLKKLKDNVEIQFFFSKSNQKVPMQLKAFADQTEDFLREYERASNGKVKLTVIDPKPDTDAEDLAVQEGLKGMPLDMYGAPLYLGLVVTSGKHTQTMPIIDPQKERFLEYDVSRMIYQVTHPDKPVVGVLSSIPVLGDRQPPMSMGRPPQKTPGWYVFDDLKKDFDLREVTTEEAEKGIPEDIKTLVLVHPKKISDKESYAIDQFVLRGGHLIAFVDPDAYSDESSAPNPYMPQSASSDLPKLFKAWGIKYDPSRIIVDRESGMQVREGNRAVINHAVLVYNADNVNKNDAASANLTSLRAIFAGDLVDNTDKAITVTPLITTSKNSGTAPVRTARLGSQAMLREYQDAGAPQTLALKLTGKFKTAFPDGAPADSDKKDKATDKDDKKVASLKEGTSTVVIIADVDMLADITNVQDMRTPFGNLKQQISNNGTFVANLVGQLAGDEDLISIRSRATIDRHFIRVEKLRKKAQIKFEDKITKLQQQLQEAQMKINQLQQQKSDSQRSFISDEQRAEIEKFNKQKREINKQIRQVQKDLRKDIDKLGTKVKVTNIALMPLLVILAGIFVGLRKRRK